MGVGAILMLVLALVAVGRSSTSSSQPEREVHRDPSQAEHRAAAHRIEALYAGIPQHGEVLGDPDAPVTLQFFADLECPEARHFTLGALPFIVRRWVRDGKLRIVYRAYPAETIWTDIFNRQQEAALAAGKQDKLWQYLDFFYHWQGREFTLYAVSPFLKGRAREVRGLDVARWQVDRYGSGLARKVKANVDLGHEYGLRPGRPETPAFFIGPTGGPAKRLFRFSLLESRAFDEAVEGVLRA
jgi:protein-disulfide isomerase